MREPKIGDIYGTRWFANWRCTITAVYDDGYVDILVISSEPGASELGYRARKITLSGLMYVGTLND